MLTCLKEPRCSCPFVPTIINSNTECSTESSTVVMRTKSNNVNITVFVHRLFFFFFTRRNITGSSWGHFAFPQKVMICFFLYISRYDATPSLSALSLPPHPSLFTLQIFVPSVTVFLCLPVHCHCLKCPIIYSGALSAN